MLNLRLYTTVTELVAIVNVIAAESIIVLVKSVILLMNYSVFEINLQSNFELEHLHFIDHFNVH